MAVLLRFLEPLAPLIYPPPWSIINANSTLSFLSPLRPVNPSLQFRRISFPNDDYPSFILIIRNARTNSQTSVSQFPFSQSFLDIVSRAVFKYFSLKRNRRKEGAKTKGEWSCVDKGTLRRNDSVFSSFFYPLAVFRWSIIGCWRTREDSSRHGFSREEEVVAYIVQGCLSVYSRMKESV